MNMVVVIDAKFDEAENTLDVELSGDEMGVLIGKRGQTLDSLQYLISLVVNKEMQKRAYNLVRALCEEDVNPVVSDFIGSK